MTIKRTVGNLAEQRFAYSWQDKLDAAHQLGRVAAQRGAWHTSNPYVWNTTLRRAWLVGWNYVNHPFVKVQLS